MVSLVFDASIPIALKNVGIFDLFSKFFQEEKHTLIMSKENLNECHSATLASKMKSLSCFEIIEEPNVELVKKLKKECTNLIKKELHSNKDRDYHVIACAIEKNSDFVVTNDRDMVRFFQAYQNKGNLKNTKIMTFAGFLLFMYNLRKDLFTHKVYIKTNLDTYELEEIKNYFNIMEHHQKFINADEKDVWENHALSIYKPYSDNVINSFN